MSCNNNTEIINFCTNELYGCASCLINFIDLLNQLISQGLFFVLLCIFFKLLCTNMALILCMTARYLRVMINEGGISRCKAGFRLCLGSNFIIEYNIVEIAVLNFCLCIYTKYLLESVDTKYILESVKTGLGSLMGNSLVSTPKVQASIPAWQKILSPCLGI